MTLIMVVSSLPMVTLEAEAAVIKSRYFVGDVNRDGKIDSSDLLMLALYLSNQENFDDEQMLLGDTNGDGAIDNKDCYRLNDYLSKKININFYTVKFRANQSTKNSMSDIKGGFNEIKVPENEFSSIDGMSAAEGWYMHRASDNKWLYTDGISIGWYYNDCQPYNWHKKLLKEMYVYDNGKFINQSELLSKYINKNGETITLWQQFTPVKINYEINPNNGKDSIRSLGYEYMWYGASCMECTYTNPGNKFLYWFLRRGNKYYGYKNENECGWYTDKKRATPLYSKGKGIYVNIFDTPSSSNETVTYEAQWSHEYYSKVLTLKPLPDITIKINNKNVNHTNLQALGVGSTFLYAVKPASDKKSAIMYKTDKDTGIRTLLKQNRNGKKYDYITGIGYANDMSVASVNGYSTLFIATNDSSYSSVVRMKVEGDTVTTTGNFNLYYNGSKICPSGIANWGHSNGSVHFFFTSGNTVYKASIPDNQSSGNISLTKVCYLDKTEAAINGEVQNVWSYGVQGIYYCNVNGGTLYVPVTLDNEAVVLTYQGFNKATGTMYAHSPLSFGVKGASGANLNVQGCGISNDGRLYINVNRANNGDAILYFRDYRI